MTKKACIIGASGLVGQSLTKQLAESDMYEKVIILVRNPLKIEHQKIEQKIIDYENLKNLQLGADHIFCCLGTTIKKAGSKEAFKQVDYEYPLAIAKLAAQEKSELFAIVTAMGASKNSTFFYNQVKGEVENDLGLLNIPFIGIFRPSMLLGERKEQRLAEQIGKVFMRLIDFITPAKYKAIHVDHVAEAMLKYAANPLEGITVVENDAMLAL